METTTNINEEFPVPAIKRIKYSGMDFYTKVLGAPRFVVAPMVDQSELAWRLLCRRHGAQLCYSPMYHSNIFVQDPKYRQFALQSCPEDRPLIIQFCGNDPKIMLNAALLAQDHCDAIDINLGCPQAIAKRGHYGSFLQDEWDLLHEIVSTLHQNLLIPVTCKIRVFDDIERSIKYAKMLEKAGCQLLTVHGRTREQKGPLTGLANWKFIRQIREHIQIPMFANGNIMSIEDIDRCLDETGVNGIMTAEGNLHNPAIFEGIIPKTWDIAMEYLDIVDKYPCPISYVRGHLFKLFHHLLNLKSNSNLREALAVSHTVDEFRNVVQLLKDKFSPFDEGRQTYPYDLENPDDNTVSNDFNLSLPPWLCQPYIRAPPEIHKMIIAEKIRIAEDPATVKREYYDDGGVQISRKRMKKLRRSMRRPNRQQNSGGRLKIERSLTLCDSDECVNPKGLKCEYDLCKICCKTKCFMDYLECVGHKFLLKNKRNRQKMTSGTSDIPINDGGS